MINRVISEYVLNMHYRLVHWVILSLPNTCSSFAPDWNNSLVLHFPPDTFINQFIEGKAQWHLNISVRLQVKGDINMLPKNCLKYVSLEVSGRTDYATWITEFLHWEKWGLYWHLKNREPKCIELLLSNI